VLAAISSDRRDIDSIKIAIGKGVSVTREPNRGKGLGEILRAVQRADRGRVCVASNRGIYALEAGGQEMEFQYEHSIYGTLIEWGVPLDGGLGSDATD